MSVKRKLCFIVCAALLLALCLPLGAFAYECAYGDRDVWDESGMSAHDKAWLAEWTADPAHQAAIDEAVAQAQNDLIEVYELTPEDKYPAGFYESEEAYYGQYIINYAAWDDYFEHFSQDMLWQEIEDRGGELGSINIMINDDFLSYKDARPQVVEQRVMVPFRLILEALGAAVDYHAGDSSVTALYGDRLISFAIGSEELRISENGQESVRVMDVAPYAEAGRTYVPVRFISEACGLTVNWVGSEQIVHIIDRDYYVAKFGAGFDNIDAYTHSETYKQVKSLLYPAVPEGRVCYESKGVVDYTDTETEVEGSAIESAYYFDDGRLLYADSGASGLGTKIYVDYEAGKIYVTSALFNYLFGKENLWLTADLEEGVETIVGSIEEMLSEGQVLAVEYLPFAHKFENYAGVGEYIYDTTAYESAVGFESALYGTWAYLASKFNDAAFTLEGDDAYIRVNKENLHSILEKCYPDIDPEEYDYYFEDEGDTAVGSIVYDAEARSATIDCETYYGMVLHALCRDKDNELSFKDGFGSEMQMKSYFVPFTDLPSAEEIFGENPEFIDMNEMNEGTLDF